MNKLNVTGESKFTMPLFQVEASPFSKFSNETIASDISDGQMEFDAAVGTPTEGTKLVLGSRLWEGTLLGMPSELVGCFEGSTLGTTDGDEEGSWLGMSVLWICTPDTMTVEARLALKWLCSAAVSRSAWLQRLWALEVSLEGVYSAVGTNDCVTSRRLTLVTTPGIVAI